MSSRGKPFPPEVRERAVRMVLEHQGEYPSQWAAITSITEKFGMTPETLRKWVRRAEVDAGQRPGPRADQLEELRSLRRENAELRRANEMAESTGERIGPETIAASRSTPSHASTPATAPTSPRRSNASASWPPPR